MTHDLDELATKVEAASGPSRHLDTQIFILLDPDAEHIVGQKPGPFPQEAIYGPRSSFWDWACDETKEPPQFASIPAFTASLDAAVTLVPEGWQWTAGTSDHEGEPWACVTDEACEDFTGAASTPALALAAAALRARKAMQ